jgi:D12 class N6 adenine-specific DNA methyltransferase
VEGELIQERVVLSPLRYPGGKRRLTPYLAAALKANDLEPDLFVEPFAGGASVALELLATGRVKRIGLAERDPYLAAFWSTVFFDSDWLCRKIDEIDVSLATWERLKSGTFTSRRNAVVKTSRQRDCRQERLIPIGYRTARLALRPPVDSDKAARPRGRAVENAHLRTYDPISKTYLREGFS